MIQQAVNRCVAGLELEPEEIEVSVREIADGSATHAQMAGLLVALRQKGETPKEIAAFASTLRQQGLRIHPKVHGRLIDTCGTGGDGSRTFNVSTVSAIVSAGAGAIVAKHGNRSVSSKSGSADVLERLGLNLTASPESVSESIEKIGIGFLFAPSFHPAMKQVASVRRELGITTVFNLMGPLLNPAGAKSQLVGVYAPDLVGTISQVLKLLGTEEALTVHSLEGMDEISVFGPTLVSSLKSGEIHQRLMRPSDFGIQQRKGRMKEVQGVEDAAMIAFGVLSGDHPDSPATDMVIANSAAALVVAGKADGFVEGAEEARESISSGAALKKLDELVKFSNGDTSRIEDFAKAIA